MLYNSNTTSTPTQHRWQQGKYHAMFVVPYLGLFSNVSIILVTSYKVHQFSLATAKVLNKIIAELEQTSLQNMPSGIRDLVVRLIS